MAGVAPGEGLPEDDAEIPAWFTDAGALASGLPESTRTKLERHLDLLVATEMMHGLADPDVLRDQTLAAWEAVEAGNERRDTWEGQVLGVVAVLGIAAELVTFAWITEGPPEWSVSWLWALVAPVVALVWALPLLWVLGRVLLWFWIDRDFRDFDKNFPGWEEKRRRRRLQRVGEVAAYVVLGLLMWWSGRWLLDRWPGGITGVILVPVVLVVGSVVALFVATGITSLDLRRQTDVRDELVLALASCTFWGRFGGPLVPYAPHLWGTVYGVGDHTKVPEPSDPPWRRQREARQVFAVALEGYGGRLSADAARLAPRRLRETRAWLRDYGRHVTSSFVERGRTVLLGSPSLDDEVLASLASDWALSCRGHWAELSQVEPPPLRKRLVETLGRRVGAAALLVVGALVLAPLVGDPDLQGQVRGALLGAAVLALITPRAAVEDVASSVKRLIDH